MKTEHQEELERQRAWDMLSTVEEHPQVTSWLREFSVKKMTPRRNVLRWVMAAGILISVGLGLGGYAMWSPTKYETRVGEQRDVVLPDGSRVILNTNTLLAVRYSNARRYIELERGEALFSVKRNQMWPFDVYAAGTVTRAIGTQFNVDLRNAHVTVSVLEGAVQVAAPQALASTDSPGAVGADRAGMSTIAPALAKGEAVEVRSDERRVIAEKADLRRINAWRTRRLEFSDTPLSSAIEEFNRYSSIRVVLGTPDLASVRVSGVFTIGDPDGFLFSLTEALGVKRLDSLGEITLVRTKS